MDHRICILLSTYNGETYLCEQLNSLINQIDVNIHILIRDDGSTDNTIQIIERYINAHPNLFTLIIGENIGWRKSFMNLIHEANKYVSEFDYFAFCDQDDIWLPEKLSKAIESLNHLNTDIKLYCSNQYYYQDGINKGLVRKQYLQPSIENCLIRNLAIGCTIIFNKNLLLLTNQYTPKCNPPHDFWVYQLATLFGAVFIDPNSYILYRQHNSNQVGAKITKFDIWKRRFKDIFNKKSNHKREKQAKDLIDGYGDIMTDVIRVKVELVANYKNSIKKRISLFMSSKYTTGLFSNDFWLKLRILFGQL